jgi:hypothetical protein
MMNHWYHSKRVPARGTHKGATLRGAAIPGIGSKTRGFCGSFWGAVWLPYGKIHHAIFMCKSTISIAIFNSKLLVYQAGYGGKMVFFVRFQADFFWGTFKRVSIGKMMTKHWSSSVIHWKRVPFGNLFHSYWKWPFIIYNGHLPMYPFIIIINPYILKELTLFTSPL